ncbi:MAG: hypothetical protein JST00_43120 [Deltaproteobacteria bacterium]|nr:hypothetical protein [Deltaproteobacteria bacterium]
MKRFLLFLTLVPVSIACGDGKPPESPATASKPQSNSSAEVYFPLEEGKIYSYATNDNGETGMLVAKVHRTDPAHGELRLSNATKRFVFSPEGVAYDTGLFILKAPIEVGTSWPGEHGGTTKITSTDAAPKVPAGSYSGCVQTVEEGGRPPGSRYTTTYCPGVGMVLLEVAFGGAESRAELKSYALPMKID